MKVLVAQYCLTLCDPMDCSPPRLLCLWGFPGKNTGVDCHFFLQGNLPDPGIEFTSVESPAQTGRFFTTGPFRQTLYPLLKMLGFSISSHLLNKLSTIKWCHSLLPTCQFSLYLTITNNVHCHKVFQSATIHLILFVTIKTL